MNKNVPAAAFSYLQTLSHFITTNEEHNGHTTGFLCLLVCLPSRARMEVWHLILEYDLCHLQALAEISIFRYCSMCFLRKMNKVTELFYYSQSINILKVSKPE